jgi:hypothetical protein
MNHRPIEPPPAAYGQAEISRLAGSPPWRYTSTLFAIRGPLRAKLVSVVECYRDICAIGIDPLAVVDGIIPDLNQTAKNSTILPQPDPLK